MSYKKLVSLLAVSTLALGACATDDAEEPATEDTEQTEDTGAETDETTDAEDTEETKGSSQDLIEQAKQQSGEAFPEYGLEVTGAWTVDGYEVEYAPGEAATIPVTALTDAESYNVYLLEDGTVAEVVSDTAEVEFTVEEPSADAEYVVGISPDELGEVGDEVAADDSYRYENVVLVEGSAAEESAE